MDGFTVFIYFISETFIATQQYRTNKSNQNKIKSLAQVYFLQICIYGWILCIFGESKPGQLI